MSTTNQPIKIFYSYAHQDLPLVQELDKHLTYLKRSQRIEVWNEQMLSAGSNRAREIDRQLNSADIILLFISPDFMVSDHTYELMIEAVRGSEKQGSKRVIPVLLRPTWRPGSSIEHIQSLPSNNRPVSTWKNKDAAFEDIISGLRQVVEGIQEQRRSQVNWQELAQIAASQKNYQEAMIAYEQAIQLDPLNASLFVEAGSVLMALSRLTEALSTFEQAIQIQSDNVEAHIGLGRALYLLGRYEAARDAYKRALGLDANNVAAYTGQGDVQAYLKHYVDALHNYNRALRIDPLNVASLLGSGDVYRQQQQYEQALNIYNRALALEPENSMAWLGKGDVLREMERYDEALAAYNQVIRFEPKQIAAFNAISAILYEQGRYNEALDALDQGIALDPDNPTAHQSRARILRILGRDDDVLSEYERAYRMGITTEPAGIEGVEGIDSHLRLRASAIRKFLLNAGFACRSIPDPVGFLAEPTTRDWRSRFPRGLYIRLLFDKALDQKTVWTMAQDARKYSDHGLIIINTRPDLSGLGMISTLRADMGNHRFVCLPLDESLILESLATRQEASNLQAYIHLRLGDAFDPFNEHDPVSGAVSFFGRRNIVDQMLNDLRNGQRLGLFGIHKMGKSSVMLELQRLAGFPISYIYLNKNDPLEDIYSRIVANWSINGKVKYRDFHWPSSPTTLQIHSRADFAAAARDLLTYLRSSFPGSKPMLGIFLDEIEKIFPQEGDDASLHRYIHLMDTLRGLQQETRCLALLIVGIHPGIMRSNLLWGAQKNPLFQVITERFLPPLSNEDCELMIRHLSQQANIKFDDAALKHIVALSGGHPYLARQLGSLAYRYKQQSAAKIISPDITEKVAHNFIRHPGTAAYFEDHSLWEELGEPGLWGTEVGAANHRLLLMLARSATDLTEKELCSGPDKRVNRKAFNVLKEQYIISAPEKPDSYRITFDLFRNWIRFDQLDEDE